MLNAFHAWLFPSAAPDRVRHCGAQTFGLLLPPLSHCCLFLILGFQPQLFQPGTTQSKEESLSGREAERARRKFNVLSYKQFFFQGRYSSAGGFPGRQFNKRQSPGTFSIFQNFWGLESALPWSPHHILEICVRI